jgi:hypothetical protein
MATTLFTAQQVATQRLIAAETQYYRDDPRPPPDDSSPDANEERWAARLLITGASEAEPRDYIAGRARNRPLSTLFQRQFNRLSVAHESRAMHIEQLDERRMSIIQTDDLLREWSDQTDPSAEALETCLPRNVEYIGDILTNPYVDQDDSPSPQSDWEPESPADSLLDQRR